MSKGKILLFSQFFGGLFALLIVILLIVNKTKSVNDSGLGHNTIKKMDRHEKGKVFFSSLIEALETHLISNDKKKYYWLGASQLYAINDYKYGDRAAPYVVFDTLKSQGARLLTISHPNGYPAEHLIIASYILSNVTVDGLVIGAVYDDMREQNIRREIADALKNKNTRRVLSESKIGRKLLFEAEGVLKLARFKKEDYKVSLNLMERSEQAIIRILEKYFKVESIREEGRGQITLSLIRLRQFLEGLRARYTRDISNYRYPIPDNQYQTNLDSWTELLKLASRKKVPFLVYIAPRPTDFFPYNQIKYDKFKKTISDLTQYYGGTFINLEDLIPSKYFGFVDTNFGFLVRDPFHIQGVGHSLLANEIIKGIKNLRIKSVGIK